ncbi:hypothetical protein [Microtetraspora malaysiensis]|uniref:hypothetical protein n=1 Tax=Microtetraspora malaysiensis TaxID=161358 RepID=UPI003D94701C
MIHQDAAMPISRFYTLIGIPRRTYTRWRTNTAAGTGLRGVEVRASVSDGDRGRLPLAREAESYRQVFDYIRPREALGGHRPIELYIDPGLHPQHPDRAS